MCVLPLADSPALPNVSKTHQQEYNLMRKISSRSLPSSIPPPRLHPHCPPSHLEIPLSNPSYRSRNLHTSLPPALPIQPTTRIPRRYLSAIRAHTPLALAPTFLRAHPVPARASVSPKPINYPPSFRGDDNNRAPTITLLPYAEGARSHNIRQC